jgi:gluconolactonase
MPLLLQSKTLFRKFSIIAVVCLGMLGTACSEVNTPKGINQLTSVAAANARYCPGGSENIKLDLSNIQLKREQNIPLMYQGFNNIEGPLWHDGALYYSNMGSHQPDKNGFVLSNQTTIWRWVQGEQPKLWMKDTVAGSNGLAVDNEGNLLATRQLDGSLSSIDWKSKQITAIATTYNGKRFNAPNDLTVAQDNTIYFTDPNWNTPSNIDSGSIQGGGQPGSIEPGQRIYRVTPEGKVIATAVTDLVPALADKPNGIALSLDQQQLIVGGLQGLWAFDLTAGEVSNPQKVLASPIDGLGKDCSGNIYVTTTVEQTTRTDGQVIVILDKQHKVVGQLNVEGIHIVTNVAFGGEDGKTLFVTGLTDPMDGDKPRFCGNSPCLKAGIYTAKLNVQGFPF